VVVGDALFVMGGEELDGFVLRDSIFAAAISPAGTLSPFTTGQKIPGADYMMGAAVSGFTIVLTGGFTGATAVRATTVDGLAVDTFAALTPLPERRERHLAAVLDGQLYVTGGEPNFGRQNLVTTQRAPLAFDGSLGAWQSQPDLPEALAYAASASTQELLFVLGGSTENAVSDSVYIFIPERP
jgi:hypothetical protein